MNSIFTNALPGENEDEHIYTLKELFNQNNNNENNENNNDPNSNFNNNNNEPIIDQRNLSPSNKYKDYNSKDFSESNNKIMDYNNNSFHRNRSNSKSSSRSRGRERERSRERERERERDRERDRGQHRCQVSAGFVQHHADEQRQRRLLEMLGCQSCHQGENHQFECHHLQHAPCGKSENQMVHQR